MRKKTLTLLAALLLSTAFLAGCLGGSDEPDDAGGTDPGDGTDGGDPGDGGDGGDGTGGDGTDGDGSESEGNETEEPEAPEPYTDSVSLSVGAGVGVGDEPTSDRKTFNVANEGWTSFQVTCTPEEVNADSVTITVYDPEGNGAGSASFSQGATDPQTIDVSASAPGEYAVEAVVGMASASASFTCDIVVEY